MNLQYEVHASYLKNRISTLYFEKNTLCHLIAFPIKTSISPTLALSIFDIQLDVFFEKIAPPYPVPLSNLIITGFMRQNTDPQLGLSADKYL